MRPSPRCPMCRKTLAPEAPDAPFCSRRCKLLDLGKWLDGQYVVGDEAPPNSEPQ